MPHLPRRRPASIAGALLVVTALLVTFAPTPVAADAGGSQRAKGQQAGDQERRQEPHRGPKHDRNDQDSIQANATDDSEDGNDRSGHDAVEPPAEHGPKQPGGARAKQGQKHRPDEIDDGHDERPENPPAKAPVQAATASPPPPPPPPPPRPTPRVRSDAVRSLSSGVVSVSGGLEPVTPPAPAATNDDASEPPPAADVHAPTARRPLFGEVPAPAQWVPFSPMLDDPAFPAVLLAALVAFLALFGRGDRRDPKLVEAVVDDRAQDLDFS